MASGPCEVSTYEQNALQNFKKYEIYYPEELKTSDRTYPVIVICNGSGTPLSKYPAVPKQLASWGFIVIGTEEEYAWNGFGAEMCIRYLERLNETEQTEKGEPNFFFQKIDLSETGILGHSQGDVGVINAITAQDHKEIYKAAAALSPTNQQLAADIEWEYDAGLIDTPILLISGAGGGDDWVVTLDQLEGIYDQIRSSKIMVRRSDTPHDKVLYAEQGYVTAWFMWLLQDDQEAARAFIGQKAEILSNPLYQDQQIDLKQ